MGVHNPRSPVEAIGGYTGQDDLYTTPMVVVNSEESGITGWGDPNSSLIDIGIEDDYTGNLDDSVKVPIELQLFQTGHTQNRVTEESAEYGYGVGPERKLSHYPYADQPNPFRNHDAYGRWALDDESRYRPEVVAYWHEGLRYEEYQQPTKQRSPVNPIVDQPSSQPYTDYVSQPEPLAIHGQTPGGYYG